jgi:Family of unknown function (DUF6165)
VWGVEKIKKGTQIMQANKGEVLVPISIGELLDKVTILEIKSERITDPAKLVNIHKELNALLETCKALNLSTTDVSVLELKRINETLWVVEDALRDKEFHKSFDDEFIQLARDVYFTNDQRAAVKKEINIRMGSNFVEEKSYKTYT